MAIINHKEFVSHDFLNIKELDRFKFLLFV